MDIIKLQEDKPLKVISKTKKYNIKLNNIIKFENGINIENIIDKELDSSFYEKTILNPNNKNLYIEVENKNSIFEIIDADSESATNVENDIEPPEFDNIFNYSKFIIVNNSISFKIKETNYYNKIYKPSELENLLTIWATLPINIYIKSDLYNKSIYIELDLINKIQIKSSYFLIKDNYNEEIFNYKTNDNPFFTIPFKYNQYYKLYSNNFKIIRIGIY